MFNFRLLAFSTPLAFCSQVNECRCHVANACYLLLHICNWCLTNALFTSFRAVWGNSSIVVGVSQLTYDDELDTRVSENKIKHKKNDNESTMNTIWVDSHEVRVTEKWLQAVGYVEQSALDGLPRAWALATTNKVKTNGISITHLAGRQSDQKVSCLSLTEFSMFVARIRWLFYWFLLSGWMTRKNAIHRWFSRKKMISAQWNINIDG